MSIEDYLTFVQVGNRNYLGKFASACKNSEKWRARRELNPGPPGLLRTGKSLTEHISPVLYLFRTLSRRI